MYGKTNGYYLDSQHSLEQIDNTDVNFSRGDPRLMYN